MSPAASVDVLWTLDRDQAHRQTFTRLADVLERLLDHVNREEVTGGTFEDLETAAAWLAELERAHPPIETERRPLEDLGTFLGSVAVEFVVDGWLDDDRREQLATWARWTRERAGGDRAAVAVP